MEDLLVVINTNDNISIMNKDKKGHVDLDSAHDKLADNYKIDKNINSKVSTSIKDFKSESDTINKFEKIIIIVLCSYRFLIKSIKTWIF